MKRLLYIQQNLHAPKNKVGGGRFNYRSAEDILEAVKPLLKETKTVLAMSDEMFELNGQVYLRATTTLYGEDGTMIMTTSANAKEPVKLGNMSEPQTTGSISSYARKYSLCGLFAIDATEQDVDSIPEYDHDVYDKTLIPSKGMEYADTEDAKAIEMINKANTWSELNEVWKQHGNLCKLYPNVQDAFMAKANTEKIKNTKPKK